MHGNGGDGEGRNEKAPRATSTGGRRSGQGEAYFTLPSLCCAVKVRRRAVQGPGTVLPFHV